MHLTSHLAIPGVKAREKRERLAVNRVLYQTHLNKPSDSPSPVPVGRWVRKSKALLIQATYYVHPGVPGVRCATPIHSMEMYRNSYDVNQQMLEKKEFCGPLG